MTKADRIRGAFVRRRLGESLTWATKAMIKIYQRQTPTEQARAETILENGIGFSGTDAKRLTRIAQGVIRFGRPLASQELTILHRMPKYWRQILEISDKAKIDQLMLCSGEATHVKVA